MPTLERRFLNAAYPDLNDFSALATSYLTLLQPFVPLLPDHHQELVNYLMSTTPLLRLAIQSLLAPDISASLSISSLGSTVGDCQAALLFVHAAYAQGREEEAREILNWLATTMVKASWNLVDGPGQPFELDPRYRQAIRAIWWEGWGLEVMLGAVTGVRTHLFSDIVSQVQTSDTVDDSTSPLALRVRALSLLAAATRPPLEDPVQEAARGNALSGVATNLTLITHQAYLASRATLAASPPEEQPRIAAQCEAAFMASLVCSAATIFLLTSSPFSSFLAPYSPCGLDTSTAPPPSTLPLIRSAASHIFTLIRTSLSLSPGAPPPIHSPFFGCSLLVAAQGTLFSLQGDRGGWRSVEAMSEIELAEWVLGLQAKRWNSAGTVLSQVKALKAASFGAIGLETQLLL